MKAVLRIATASGRGAALRRSASAAPPPATTAVVSSFFSTSAPAGGVFRSSTIAVDCHSTISHRHSNSSSSRNITVRSFASESDSHSDFAPQKKKVVEDSEAALKLIDEHVKANPVMLYMKGTPGQPMCGFSAKVVGVLAEQGVDYGSVNVLDYPSIREGVKQFSQWPTIPQLFVHGEFIGGCDIVSEMHSSGELEELLKPVKETK